MHKLLAIEAGSRFDCSTSHPQLSGTTSGAMATRTRISGLLLGLLLAISAHGQPQSVAASSAAPVPIETGYYIKFKVKPGKNADFEKAIKEMMIGVRAKEPGNLYCDLFHLPQDLQAYAIIERYRDAAASKEHAESAYIKKLGTALADNVLDGPPELQALVFIRSK